MSHVPRWSPVKHLSSTKKMIGSVPCCHSLTRKQFISILYYFPCRRGDQVRCLHPPLRHPSISICEQCLPRSSYVTKFVLYLFLDIPKTYSGCVSTLNKLKWNQTFYALACSIILFAVSKWSFHMVVVYFSLPCHFELMSPYSSRWTCHFILSFYFHPSPWPVICKLTWLCSNVMVHPWNTICRRLSNSDINALHIDDTYVNLNSTGMASVKCLSQHHHHWYICRHQHLLYVSPPTLVVLILHDRLS